MSANLAHGNLLSTGKYLVSMARDPMRCMRQMGLDTPTAVMMPTKLNGKGRRLLYITGSANVRPVYTDTYKFLTSNVPLRSPGGGAQANLRRGLIGAQGEEHLHYRASFAAQTGRAMMSDFAENVARLAANWLAKIPTDRHIDIVASISDLVRYYSVVMMFKDDNPEAAVQIGRQITEWIELGYQAGNVLFPVNIPGLPHARYRQVSENLESKILSWAAERRGMDAKRDVLSMFVNGPDEHGKPLSDDRLAGHIATIFAAAFTSSVSSLVWAIFILSQHPQIAHDLCDELEASGIDPQCDGMKLLELPLLDHVLKESMRLFTPVPYQVRRVTGDAEPNGIALRRRDIVVIGAWATNRLASVYPDAEKFKPERWATTDANSYDYLTFSAGPRRCVGFSLAQIMVKITLATILLNRRPLLQDNLRIDTKVAVTLRAKRPIMLRLADTNAKITRAQVSGTVTNCFAL